MHTSDSVVNVLAVDSDGPTLAHYRRLCQRFQINLTEARDAEEALRLSSDSIHIVIVELGIPTMGGIELIAELRNRFPRPEVIIISSSRSFTDAVRAIRLGVFDFLEKPVLLPTLSETISRCLARQKGEAGPLRPAFLSPRVPAMQLPEELRKPGWRDDLTVIARSDATVLLTGEHGTGRMDAARLIHEKSERRHAPFVSINCEQFQAQLTNCEATVQIEQAVGAFHWWNQQIGKATGGTLFLAAIDTLPLNFQAKLLALLPENQAENAPVNSQGRFFPIRVIAATDRDLGEMCDRRLFRADVFYRLDVMHLHMPALRERKPEIPALISSIVAEICARQRRPIVSLESLALARLLEYPWPGNLMELRSVLEQAINVCDGEILTRSHLGSTAVGCADSAFSFSGRTLADIERHAVLHALCREGGDKSRAARSLAISPELIDRKLQKPGHSEARHGSAPAENREASSDPYEVRRQTKRKCQSSNLKTQQLDG